MGYFDDIGTRIQQTASEVLETANDYFKNQQSAAQPSVKQGPTPTANLTALQLEQGIRPGIPGVMESAPAPAVKVESKMDMKKIGIVAALGAAAFFFLKKRRRG